MDAIELLRHEHRQMDRLLDRMEEVAREGRAAGASANAASVAVFFTRAAEFIQLFIEGAHQAKENALHKEMTLHGLPVRSGVLKQLADEHILGREHSRALQNLARRVLEGSPELEALLDDAEGYVRLHRTHTQMEDTHLLPLAQRIIGAEGLERLRSRFAEIEARYGPLSQAADAVELIFGASGMSEFSR